MMTTRAIAAALALAAILSSPAPILAHAFLDHSDPAVGSTVPAAPAALNLWFTQELEPAFSWVTVTDKSGATVNDGTAAIDPNDQTKLIVKLKPLDPGTYTVKWHVLSVDTHTTEGDFVFHVGKG